MISCGVPGAVLHPRPHSRLPGAAAPASRPSDDIDVGGAVARHDTADNRHHRCRLLRGAASRYSSPLRSRRQQARRWHGHQSRRWHWAHAQRVHLAARRGGATASVLGVVGGLLMASINLAGPSAAVGSPGRALRTPNADLEHQFGGGAPPALPAATTPPAPAPPSLAAGPPLRSHEVFAFAPWWNLADESGFEVQDLTTIAYFSVDVNPDGTIDESASNAGWVGYESQALADLVSRAHAADDRVVLTVTCFDQQSLDELTSDPGVANTMGTTLTQLISAKNLDGVNFDFEGTGAQDRQGLDNLIAAVSAQLRTADPHWQITMSTYGSSAGDSTGFFDIAGLAPSVDGFFVMAYDMNNPSAPSPTSPLSGPGNADATDLDEYIDLVPRSKIILGVPYYGYDWPTTGPDVGSAATGPPTAVTYAQVVADNSPTYWDPTSQTPWTAYQSGTQWHQVYFDNPTSLALKARLANSDGIAGVGVWALGMDSDDPAMLAALLGNAAPTKFAAGPPVSTTTTAPGASGATGTTPTYSYQGVWQGTTETLSPVTSSLPGSGDARSAGKLQSFSTDDPSSTCLSSGPPLPVYELQADPTTYVVQVSTPDYCATGTWQFTAPATSASSGGSTSSTTTSPGSTTTTTPPVTVPPVTPTTSAAPVSDDPPLL